jgi:hypothetical protein
MSEALIELNDLIKNNKVSVFNDIQLDISKFELSYGANCTDVKLVDSDYISLFSNMCFVSGYSFNSLSDTYKIKSRKIVEDNLTEILCILVSDLGKANKLDVREIERLTRLIDKVNYIRGQY